MKRRFPIVLALMATLAIGTVSTPAVALASQQAACTDYSKRELMNICHLIRRVFGKTAWMACVDAVKSCRKS